MGFSEVLSHLYSIAIQVFKKNAIYLPVGESESLEIEVFETASPVLENAGATIRVRSRIVVSVAAIAEPKYRDKVTLNSQDWYVEKISQSQDSSYWELDIRRDEKLIYG